MRIAVGGISQETCSFSQLRSDLDFFRRTGSIYFAEREDLIPLLSGTSTQVGGTLAAAAEQDVEVVPTFAAAALSGGPMTEEALEWMVERILRGIEEAPTLDGVILAMHGATMSEGRDDVTGYLLERVRCAVGPGAKIGVSLDLHANPYPRWTELAEVIVSFHTYPHEEQDLYRTGYEAARLLIRGIRGDVSPVVSLSKAPLLLAPERQPTGGDGPFADMQRRARRAAEGDPRILGISLLPVQPQIDAPGTGFSALVVTDGAPELGRETAERFADEAWRRRHEFEVRFYAPADAVQEALRIDGRPVILADGADGVGGGAPGDGTQVLRALLESGCRERSMLTCIDPEAVRQAVAAGFGSTVTLRVGGKRDSVFNTPVEVTGRVRTITEASYRAYGMRSDMGPCVVLEIGSIELLLITNTVHVINPGVYRAAGLEPTEAKIVLVKSPAQFREHFEPIAADILFVDAPGVCSSNFGRMPYRRITRPMYPWDDEWVREAKSPGPGR